MLKSPLDDQIVTKIKELLDSYEIACENTLYRSFNITKVVKDIRDVRNAINYAENGPTYEEMARDWIEYDRTNK